MKRNVFFRLALCCFALLLLVPLFAFSVSAASGKATLGLSSKSVYVGNTVKVTVTYSSSTPMATWSFGIKYDSSRLQYVSGAHSTSGGTLNFVDQPQSGGVKSKSYTITFKALKLGDATVSTVTREVYAEDYSSISVSDVSRTISIVEKPAASGENRLSSLTAEGVELTPAFDKSTETYSATVPYATKTLSFVTETVHSAAKVTVRGADALALGENEISVVVTAENGDGRTYTVKVVREDSPYVGAEVIMGESTLTFPRDASEVLSLPEGFAPAEGEYLNRKVLLFANGSATLRLAVLQEKSVDETGAETLKEKLFLFDAANGTFYPYVSVSTKPQEYVFVDAGKDPQIPEGFSSSMLMVDGVEIDAWTKTQDGRVITLVFAAPTDGEPAFYEYDEDASSFTLYREVEAVPEGPDTEDVLATLDRVTEEKNTLLLYLQYGVLIGGALVFLLLLLVIILAAVARKRKKKLRAREEDADEPLYTQAALAAREERVRAEEELSAPRFPVTEETAEVLEQIECEEEESSAEPSDTAEVFSKEEKPFVPLWKEADFVAADLPPVTDEASPAPAPEPVTEAARTGHPEVERIFGKTDKDEMFRQNNPILEDDDDEGDDAPIYGFDE